MRLAAPSDMSDRGANTGSKVLLLNSSDQQQTGRSGYPAIIADLRNAEEINVPRQRCDSLTERVGRKLLRTVAACSWVDISSFRLELTARRRWAEFDIVHLLWADRDWCLIDRLLPTDKRLVGTFHACDDDFGSIIRNPRRLRRFDAIILMSETQRENFIGAGVDPQRLHVIRHGIDTHHFQPGRKADDGTFRLLHVGSYRRDFDVLYEACLGLTDESNIRIQLLTAPAVAERFSALPNVDILPRLSDEELLKAYQSNDCLLMTATGATANNAILEGMACGLPVITQEVGGIPEYVTTDCGILCDPESPSKLASAIKGLAFDRDRGVAMGKAARQQAELLDWKHVAVLTDEVYSGLVGP